MAYRYPYARWYPLGAQTQTRMSAHDIVCAHTMVGYLTTTDRYFRIGNGEGYRGTESHYGIGGKWGPDLTGDLDGAVYQWQDRAYTADANYQGNPRVISIETADNAARPIQAWTPKQLTALIRLIAWECSKEAHGGCPSSWRCHQEGIPPVLIPDTLSTRRGIGYHAQGAGEYIRGEWWSMSKSKDCPTTTRINQLKSIIIPAVQRLQNPSPPTEDIVATIEELEDAIRGVFHFPDSGLAVPKGQAHNGNLAAILVGSAQGTYNSLNAIKGAITAVQADVDLQGDDEAKILAALAEVEESILAALPEPPPPATP